MNDSGSPLPPIVQIFDWKNPDYELVLRQRGLALQRIRRDPGLLSSIKEFYADGNFADFICDWGMTHDPRLLSHKIIPFIPFPVQIKFFRWIETMWENKNRGVVDKSRDLGASWCAIAWSVSAFLFVPDFAAGFGSRKEDLIDKKGDPKSLFYKARKFIELLPPEFQPEGWNERRDAPFLLLKNPENGSTIAGEAGDSIGRGGRTSIYFVDESAYLERPNGPESALSENTNTQIDISTHNGVGTLFYKKLHALPRHRIFIMDWRDDPRKSQAWYDDKKSDPATDPIIFAQEIDRNPSASVGDGFIPESLVIDAMNRGPASAVAQGPFIVSVDVAAMGRDKSVITIRRGDVVFPQIKVVKKEGDELGDIIIRHCDGLLASRIAPLGAIILELEGPGYALKIKLKSSRYRKAVRAIHPGQKLGNSECFNVRALMWKEYKSWLEEGCKSMPNDPILRMQTSSIRYKYKNNKLLIEAKEDYRARMATDPRNKMAGPSPDEADSIALNFVPVPMANIVTIPSLVDAGFGRLSDFGDSWKPLDSSVGY